GAVTGVALADYDNDGDTDLYLLANVSNRLYENLGGGLFEEVLDADSGLSNDSPTASAVFGDYDNDGYLDLYVGNHINFDGSVAANQLFHNNQDGTFTDVTTAAGLSVDGATLAVLFSDVDGDGDSDILVCNDQGSLHGGNRLYQNDGASASPRFSDVSTASGFDQALLCQGLTGGADVNGDGSFDYYLSTVDNNLFFENTAGVLADAATASLQLSTDTCTSESVSSWGAAFIDADNDCQLDLFVTNGYRSTSGTPANALAPVNALLRQDGGAFSDISFSSRVADPRRGRDVAYGDFDGDGDQDLILVNLDGSPVFYRNQSTNSNGWISVSLTGRQSNADGLGAKVEVQANSCLGTFEKLSRHNLNAVHMGLGASDMADELLVTWPSGIEQKVVYVPSMAVALIEPVVTTQSASGPASAVAEGADIVMDITFENHTSANADVDYVVDVWVNGVADGWGSADLTTSVSANSTGTVQVTITVPTDAAGGVTTDIELVTT
ncbi:CRTAC1 family protein, partial [Myxococcota bacterium]|nr:CRTAC1 family protein [Myxococcota bacterium]